MKTCTKCRQTKPFSEFHKQSSSKDRLHSWCKNCAKTATSAYQKSDKGKQAQNRFSQSEKGKRSNLCRMKRYRKNNPDRKIAHSAVNNAIQAGQFPKASNYVCSCVCGNKAYDYHHHLGYEPEHQLHVLPVCKNCHRKIHKVVSEYF